MVGSLSMPAASGFIAQVSIFIVYIYIYIYIYSKCRLYIYIYILTVTSSNEARHINGPTFLSEAQNDGCGAHSHLMLNCGLEDPALQLHVASGLQPEVLKFFTLSAVFRAVGPFATLQNSLQGGPGRGMVRAFARARAF